MNTIDPNIILFDNTSLSFIYQNIYDSLINAYRCSDLVDLTGYQLHFFNRDLLNNGHIFLIDCSIDDYETT